MHENQGRRLSYICLGALVASFAPPVKLILQYVASTSCLSPLIEKFAVSLSTQNWMASTSFEDKS